MYKPITGLFKHLIVSRAALRKKDRRLTFMLFKINRVYSVAPVIFQHLYGFKSEGLQNFYMRKIRRPGPGENIAVFIFRKQFAV